MDSFRSNLSRFLLPFRSLSLVLGLFLGFVSCLRFEEPWRRHNLGLIPWAFDAFLKGFPRLLGRLGTVVIDRSVSDGRRLPSRGWPIGVCANTRRCVPWQLASQDQRGPLLFASSTLLLIPQVYCMMNHTGSDSIRGGGHGKISTASHCKARAPEALAASFSLPKPRTPEALPSRRCDEEPEQAHNTAQQRGKVPSQPPLSSGGVRQPGGSLLPQEIP